MAETLPELLRRHGLGVASVPGIRKHVVSRIANGHVRAQRKTLARLAEALGEDVQVVVAACDQCWSAGEARRAAAASPAMSPAVACPESTTGSAQ